MRYFKPILIAFWLLFPLPVFAASPLVLEGASYHINKDAGTITYDNPVAHIDDMRVSGTSLVYNKETKVGKFVGNIVVQGKDYVINADEAIYNSDTKAITFYNVQFYDAKALAFINAATLTKLGPDYFKLIDAQITLCKPGEQDWYFKNSSVYYYVDDYAQSYNTTLYFLGVPVFYSPYFAWPTKKGRASGYLAPEFLTQSGNPDESKNWGGRINIPYFFALDIDHDLTMTFDVIQKRGTGLGLEYNYAFTDGMAGKLDFWGISETQDRDPTLENFGALENSSGLSYPEEFNSQPQRYKFNFNHRQNIPLGGQAFVSSYQISDNEVFKEYDNKKSTLEFHQQQSVGFTFPWSGGGLNVSWNTADKYLYQSIYDQSNNKNTYLNRMPTLGINHRFGGIFDTNLNLDTKYKFVEYTRIEGWSGQWNQVSGDLSYPFNLDFLNVIPSVGQDFYEVDPLYKYARSEAKVASFDSDPTATSFSVERKRLEINFEVYRLFNHRSGVADARLSFVPKVIYEEVSDVDQRGLVSVTPGNDSLVGDDADFSSQSYSSDYSKYGYMFESPIYSQKILYHVLEGNLLTKNLFNNAVTGAFSFNLTQPYNLNRKEDLTTQNQSFVGPQIPEANQETSLGNQKMPLRATFGFSPNKFFNTSVFYRYGHEEKKILENRFSVGTKSELGSTVQLAYKNNTKAYTELDGSANHLATQNYSVTQHLLLTQKLTLDASGVWDLTRTTLGQIEGTDTENLIDRSLVSLDLGFTYRMGCYDYYLGYSERLTTYEGVEGVDQQVLLSVNLSGWPGTSNPYQTKIIQRQ
ncbi:MAG: hypothetical protein QNL04_00370 [SAR324 cluster bacterium]|nr:hypothetical protein [SAR324 cluster bacterium]